MEYKDLKDGTTVQMYVPANKCFYSMNVTKRVDGGFSISNLGKRNGALIGGHEHLSIIRSQDDMDNFFYLTEKITEDSFREGEEQYARNKKGWIYE